MVAVDPVVDEDSATVVGSTESSWIKTLRIPGISVMRLWGAGGGRRFVLSFFVSDDDTWFLFALVFSVDFKTNFKRDVATFVF